MCVGKGVGAGWWVAGSGGSGGVGVGKRGAVWEGKGRWHRVCAVTAWVRGVPGGR